MRDGSRHVLAPDRRPWEHFGMRQEVKSVLRVKKILAVGVLMCVAGSAWAGVVESFLAGATMSCGACDLAGLDLSGRELKRAKLDGADLKGVTLVNANLF